MIIDESIVLFGMEDPVAGSPDLTLLVIEHPSLAQILKIAFGAVWASGLTFEQARERLSHAGGTRLLMRAALVAAAATLALLAGQASGASDPPGGSTKLRGDLAALVAGDAALDARLRDLVPGLQAGEIPFLALLTVPNDDARRAELEAAGARVLRSYRSTPLFALAGSPVTVLRVAAHGSPLRGRGLHRSSRRQPLP